MTEVKFYDKAEDELLKFAVIISKTRNKYVFCKHKDKETFGMLFFADITRLEEQLHSEIEKITIMDELPKRWTYPDIQPELMKEAKRRGFL